VERAARSVKTGRSGSTEWRFAVTCGERRLLMAAETEREMDDWIRALQQVIECR
jgi:hypothetical protein